MKDKAAMMFALLLVATLVSACSGNVVPASEENKGIQYENSAPSEPSNTKTAFLKVEGMTCPSCSAGLEYQLKQVEGVISASADYKEGKAEVVFDPNRVTPEEIVAASTVYTAEVVRVE